MNVPLLTQALEMGLIVAEDKTRDNSVLHVTDLAVAIGEGCPRQLWLRLRGADKKKPTAGQMLMFWHGKRIHQDLTDLLKKGLPREWEIIGVEIPMEFGGILGTADCIIKSHSTDEIIVVDYKTVRGRGFYFIENAPKPAHKLQVQSYCYGLDVSRQYDTDGGMILYVDREGQNAFKQFPVTRDDEVVMFAMTEVGVIRDAIKPPPILSPIVSGGKPTKTKGVPVNVKQPWMCDYCEYQYVSCHGALPKHLRNAGVVGHVKGGNFAPTKDLTPEVFADIIEQLVDNIPF